MLAWLAGSKNHRSLPFFSISLLTSRAGAAKRIRLRYCPLLASAFEYTDSVLLSVCLALRYSIRFTVTANDRAGLRTASLAARIVCASVAACADDIGPRQASRAIRALEK